MAMNKRQKISLAVTATVLVTAAGLIHFLHPSRSTNRTTGIPRPEASEGTKEDPQARARWDWLRLHDPKTGSIPAHIASRELAFAHSLPRPLTGRHVPVVGNWTGRGPANIGGRTKAVALDVRNEDVILAGGVSSGMWKSTDGGQSWRKTTAPDQLQSVSCIAQNRFAGRQDTWYYGTGEGHPAYRGGSAAGPLMTNAYYRGDGLFKSTDNGESWSQVPSTVSGTPTATDAFDFIYRLATFEENGVYAATGAGLYRSTNGGDTWTHVLGEGLTWDPQFGEQCVATDVIIGGDGTVYASMGGITPYNGIYRSKNGTEWENISPSDWPDTTGRTVIAAAPSNPKAVYFFTEERDFVTKLRKYTQGSGWTDLTADLPNGGDLQTYTGNMLVLAVKPDDENTLFLGTVGMFRSKNGGSSFELIGGNPTFHVDQHAFVFYPSDPKRMIVGNDGGLFRTDDNTAAPQADPNTGEMHIHWESLNHGYLTTQFYTVALDHATPGSALIAGGMQDNGCMYTDVADPATPWKDMIWGDGGYIVVSDSGKVMYANAGAGFEYWKFTPNGLPLPTMQVTPAGAVGAGLWLAPFILDAHDNRIMYLTSRAELWRNSNLTQIPYVFPPTPSAVNWEQIRLENITHYAISALGMSEALPRRLYFGDIIGDLFRIDDPHTGQPTAAALPSQNLPWGDRGYVHCLAVDPRDANKVIAVFPCYGIISMWASEDGGGHWTPVAGNLEEHPDGSGAGPSVRWVSILYVQDQPIYFAGTSVGLFSTTKLDSMNTVWVQEGAETIGNVVVDMIDSRQSDGFVVVGTQGNGVYSAIVTEIPSAVRSPESFPRSFALENAYPNPFNATTRIRFSVPEDGPVRLAVFDVRGAEIAVLVNGHLPAGDMEVRWDAVRNPSGMYLIRLTAGGRQQTRKVALVR
jgi:photosystem II stability/assembly factor-like uncharacterized protein